MPNIFEDFVEELEVEDVVTISKYNPSLQVSVKKIILENETGFAPDLVDPEAATFQKLNGVYEYEGVYNVTIKISELDITTEELSPCNIGLLGYTCSADGFNAIQETPDSVKISGTAENAFRDTYFKFLTLNDTVEILPASTTEYKTVIEWGMPDVKTITIYHNLTLSITSSLSGYGNTIETISIPQKVSWKWQTGLQQFQRLLAGGTQ